ncbi:MAG: type II secretion system F family protein [Dehalococcoidia bacterium]
MQWLLPLLAGLSVALLVFAIGRPNRPDDTRRRLERIGEDVETDPLSPSFGDRILRPLMGNAANSLARVLPARIEGRIRRDLQMAGDPASFSRFVAIWLAAGVVSPIIFVIAFLSFSSTSEIRILEAGAFWSFVGLYLPWNWLRRKVRARGLAIQRSLPDAIDLVITNVEAGLGFQAALLSVAEKMPGPAGQEFGHVVRDISLGRDRSEAFEQMATRCGVQEMRVFARAVSQAERTGAPIARVLRNHAAESRERRRQRAREMAGKVPVKITLPTALFMFPTLLILLLGPVIIHAMDVLGAPR